MKIFSTKKNQGFALLFAVLVSSILLTIGLSIFGITLKELAISTASRQSVYAFYAADSGLEFALYRDTKKGNILTFDDQQDYGYSTSTTAGTDILNPLFVDDTDQAGPNFYIQITKSWHSSSRDQIDATITTTGHDSVGSDRVEREIEESY